jgi:hypothetical protein
LASAEPFSPSGKRLFEGAQVWLTVRALSRCRNLHLDAGKRRSYAAYTLCSACRCIPRNALPLT